MGMGPYISEPECWIWRRLAEDFLGLPINLCNADKLKFGSVVMSQLLGQKVNAFLDLIIFIFQYDGLDFTASSLTHT